MQARARLLLPTLCIVAGALRPAAHAGAQAAAPAPRPAFENLRFREDWSKAPSGDPLDPLKHIALGEGGAAWLSFGGHVRVRGESVQNFLGGGAGTRTDAFTAVRAHLHADLHLGTHVRAFVEGRFADVSGRELPGGARAIDRDRGDLGNAFVELGGTMNGVKAAARVGRQELLLGRERIISPLDWANVRRVFEGAAVEARRGSLALGAFAAHPLTLRPLRRDIADDVAQLWGTTAAWQAPRGGRIVEGAILVKSLDAVGTTPSTKRSAATARVVTPLARPDLLLEVEGGAQQVSTSGNTSYATMLASDLTWSPKRRWTPSFALGFDRASGTAAGERAQSGTWDQLYPLAHAYAGYADVLGRRNLVEERFVVQFSPLPAGRFRTGLHSFQRASTADAAYDATGGVFRAGNAGTSRAVGTELDVTLQWRLGRHMRMDGGFARFAPGAFMKESGSARAYSWLFSALTATF
ncbi:MAG: alginate export family protein [Gemmatimonadaceae bacterium]|nr:alginate export family protein [Gemmatimonadaceae bacterium]